MRENEELQKARLQRKVCYISGTRADYGLMASSLKAIAEHPVLDLTVLVTGTHLSSRYGLTVREIELDNLRICGQVKIPVDEPSGISMASGIGIMLQKFTDILANESPDILLILGDRGEMLAGALAAIHMNIPIVHIHGGERSGTVDEPIRHAISKLAHWHCVATNESKERLVRMGEESSRIIVTGAPGLDGLLELASIKRPELTARIDFDATQKIALLVFHPVLQEQGIAGAQVKKILDSLVNVGIQVLAIGPNSDAGSSKIHDIMKLYSQKFTQIKVLSHIKRREFVSWMATCDLMIGNSSSGIIEAATFGTPVINVGSRQNLRERNKNIIDVKFEESELKEAIEKSLLSGKSKHENIYGDGQAGLRIVNILSSIDLAPNILTKTNAY